MKSIDEILNFLGNFDVSFRGRDIHLVGCLTKRNKNIVLECRANEDNADLLNTYDSLQIIGSVAGSDVTLLGCQVSSAHYIGVSNECGMLTVTPSEIVIGRSTKKEVRVNTISSSMKDLNKMLTGKVFETNFHMTKENPSVLQFAFPEEITAVDNDGKLSIVRSFGVSNGRDGVEIKITPIKNNHGSLLCFFE